MDRLPKHYVPSPLHVILGQIRGTERFTVGGGRQVRDSSAGLKPSVKKAEPQLQADGSQFYQFALPPPVPADTSYGSSQEPTQSSSSRAIDTSGYLGARPQTSMGCSQPQRGNRPKVRTAVEAIPRCGRAERIDFSRGIPDTELAAFHVLNEVVEDSLVLGRALDNDRDMLERASQHAIEAKIAYEVFDRERCARGRGRGGGMFHDHNALHAQFRKSQEEFKQSTTDLFRIVGACQETSQLADTHAVRILKALRAVRRQAIDKRRVVVATYNALNFLEGSNDLIEIASRQTLMLTDTHGYDIEHTGKVIGSIRRAQIDMKKVVCDLGVAARLAADLGAESGTGSFTPASVALKPLPGPAREQLPIDRHRERIISSVQFQPVTCIQGETGCGKSSRVPQYVYFDVGVPTGKQIVITQPRRLACITLAKRVAQEMGEPLGHTVGYRIAGDVMDSAMTKLLFVTTGYLLQTLVNDPTKVKKFSHVILDEVHERSVEADLLTLVLKLVKSHNLAEFSLVLMSATLQGGLFTNYFRSNPSDKMPEPIFVGVKRFNLDILYLEDIFQLRRKFDRPDLAICVLDILRANSGQVLSEESSCVLQEGLDRFHKSLEMAAKKNQSAAFHNAAIPINYDDSVDSEFWRINQDNTVAGETTIAGERKLWVKPQIQDGFFKIVLDLIRMLGREGESILVFLPGIGEITDLFEVLAILEEPCGPILYKIYALHSTIPMDEQQEAFAAIPENTVNVYLASTVAESSITLPSVRVVIDFGLKRHIGFDKTRNVASLMTGWCSHASCSQRSGRTGRVFEGLCIRMIPKLFYQQAMAQFDPAEIENAPLEKLYLNVKQLSHKLRERMPRVGALPPRQMLQLTVQPPPVDRLEDAISNLANLGALTSTHDHASITLLGHLATFLPLDLRLCRLILFGTFFNCVVDAVVIACCLSAQDPFSMPTSMVLKDEMHYLRSLQRSYESRLKFDDGLLSEPLMLRNLFVAWMKGLNPQTMEETREQLSLPHMRRQHSKGMQASNSQRYKFVHHSAAFGKKHAIMPKRMTLLALTVMDVASRVAEWVPEKSVLQYQLYGLLKRLGVENNHELVDVPMRPISDLFAQDAQLLRLTLLAACMPQIGAGKVKAKGEHSVMAQSILSLPNTVNPFRNVFCIQQVSEAYLTHKEMLRASFVQKIEQTYPVVALGEKRQMGSLKCVTDLGDKNLYFVYDDASSSESEEEVFVASREVVTGNAVVDEDSSSSEEEVSDAESESSISRVRQREGTGDDSDADMPQRQESESEKVSEVANTEQPVAAQKKETAKERRMRKKVGQDRVRTAEVEDAVEQERPSRESSRKRKDRSSSRKRKERSSSRRKKDRSSSRRRDRSSSRRRKDPSSSRKKNRSSSRRKKDRSSSRRRDRSSSRRRKDPSSSRRKNRSTSRKKDRSSSRRRDRSSSRRRKDRSSSRRKNRSSSRRRDRSRRSRSANRDREGRLDEALLLCENEGEKQKQIERLQKVKDKMKFIEGVQRKRVEERDTVEEPASAKSDGDAAAKASSLLEVEKASRAKFRESFGNVVLRSETSEMVAKSAEKDAIAAKNKAAKEEQQRKSDEQAARKKMQELKSSSVDIKAVQTIFQNAKDEARKPCSLDVSSESIKRAAPSHEECSKRTCLDRGDESIKREAVIVHKPDAKGALAVLDDIFGAMMAETGGKPAEDRAGQTKEENVIEKKKVLLSCEQEFGDQSAPHDEKKPALSTREQERNKKLARLRKVQERLKLLGQVKTDESVLDGTKQDTPRARQKEGEESPYPKKEEIGILKTIKEEVDLSPTQDLSVGSHEKPVKEIVGRPKTKKENDRSAETKNTNKLIPGGQDAPGDQKEKIDNNGDRSVKKEIDGKQQEKEQSADVNNSTVKATGTSPCGKPDAQDIEKPQVKEQKSADAASTSPSKKTDAQDIDKPQVKEEKSTCAATASPSGKPDAQEIEKPHEKEQQSTDAATASPSGKPDAQEIENPQVKEQQSTDAATASPSGKPDAQEIEKPQEKEQQSTDAATASPSGKPDEQEIDKLQVKEQKSTDTDTTSPSGKPDAQEVEKPQQKEQKSTDVATASPSGKPDAQEIEKPQVKQQKSTDADTTSPSRKPDAQEFEKPHEKEHKSTDDVTASPSKKTDAQEIEKPQEKEQKSTDAATASPSGKPDAQEIEIPQEKEQESTDAATASPSGKPDAREIEKPQVKEPASGTVEDTANPVAEEHKVESDDTLKEKNGQDIDKNEPPAPDESVTLDPSHPMASLPSFEEAQNLESDLLRQLEQKKMAMIKAHEEREKEKEKAAMTKVAEIDDAFAAFMDEIDAPEVKSKEDTPMEVIDSIETTEAQADAPPNPVTNTRESDRDVPMTPVTHTRESDIDVPMTPVTDTRESGLPAAKKRRKAGALAEEVKRPDDMTVEELWWIALQAHHDACNVSDEKQASLKRKFAGVLESVMIAPTIHCGFSPDDGGMWLLCVRFPISLATDVEDDAMRAPAMDFCRRFRCSHWGALDAYRRVRAELRYWTDIVSKLKVANVVVGECTIREWQNYWVKDGLPVPIARPKCRVTRDFYWRAMRILHQFGAGKNSIGWNLRRGYGESERVDLKAPNNPFLLEWRYNDLRVVGQWRNPVGMVLSAPSRKMVAKLRSNSEMNLPEGKFDRLCVFTNIQATESKMQMEGLTVLPPGAQNALHVLCFLRPKQCPAKLLVDLDKGQLISLRIREDATLPLHRIPYTKLGGLNFLRLAVNACFQKDKLDTSIEIAQTMGCAFDYVGSAPATYQGLGQAWIDIQEMESSTNSPAKALGNFVEWDASGANASEGITEQDTKTFELLPLLRISEDIQETIETRLQMRTGANEFILQLRETVKDIQLNLKGLREQVNDVDDLIDLAKKHAKLNDGNLLATDYEASEQHYTVAWHYNNTIQMALQLLKNHEETAVGLSATNSQWVKPAKRVKNFKNQGARAASTATDLLAKCETFQRQVEEIVNSWTLEQTGLTE